MRNSYIFIAMSLILISFWGWVIFIVKGIV